MMTSVIGRNCFHVRLISLSYRIRGYAPRAQMNNTLTNERLIIIITSLRIFKGDAIMNRTHLIIPMAIMFMYSAIKISAKVPELYSVLNPETSSDSPSAKSNGVRLVSAREVIIQVINSGHNINRNTNEFILANLFMLSVVIIIIGVRITRAMLTSYEIV